MRTVVTLVVVPGNLRRSPELPLSSSKAAVTILEQSHCRGYLRVRYTVADMSTATTCCSYCQLLLYNPSAIVYLEVHASNRFLSLGYDVENDFYPLPKDLHLPLRASIDLNQKGTGTGSLK